MTIEFSSDLKGRFPDLRIFTLEVKDVEIAKRSDELEKFKETIFAEVREKYDLESLKYVSAFRMYRDFFWKIGIDPTKNRPASEALIRRILAGKHVPNINTLVDTYNLASVKSEVALAAFDEEKLEDELTMRFAVKDERFLGIGMEKPMNLKGGEVVVSDSKRLIALYPYRDAEYSKVSEKTKNVLVVVCGVPGITSEILNHSKQVTMQYIIRFCRGKIIS